MYPKRQTIVGITFWTLGESRGKNTRMNVAPSFELGSAQERVVGARTVLFRLANCQDELLLCCSSRLRTFLRRVTNFRYSNVIVFFELSFLKKLSFGVLCVLGVISLFVTALRHSFLWISFELPFTVLCVLGGPSLSVPALLFLFLTFCFRIF